MPTLRNPRRGSILLYSLFLSAFLAAFFTAFRGDLGNLSKDSESNAKSAAAAGDVRTVLVDASDDPQSALSPTGQYSLTSPGYDGRYFYKTVFPGNPAVFTVSRRVDAAAKFNAYVAKGAAVTVKTYASGAFPISETVVERGAEVIAACPPV